MENSVEWKDEEGQKESKDGCVGVGGQEGGRDELLRKAKHFHQCAPQTNFRQTSNRPGKMKPSRHTCTQVRRNTLKFICNYVLYMQIINTFLKSLVSCCNLIKHFQGKWHSGHLINCLDL